ncbi:NO-binding membrane sensor protein with MHYT domain [Deinococcus metalli]|nr:MHYT domain-containing protein [Deinococcus metalli]MBB5375820.1 NO-binding membrane sensor protein with MHYT domain [Deinococcus metalli]
MEHPLIQTWSASYVGLSYVIATLTSFISLELAGRAGRAQAIGSGHFWQIAQALLLGYGIWAMHFIGMLALHSNMPSTFELLPTALSGLAAVALVYPALRILHAGPLTLGRLALAGAVAGSGISAMHYLGMAAYRIPGTTVELVWAPLLASVAIAVGASMVALLLFGLLASSWAAQQKRATLYGAKALAALVMGVAITGMHYTGMAALHYVIDPNAEPSRMAAHGADPSLLALVVGVVTFLLLGLAVTSIAMDTGESTAHLDAATG